MVTPGITRLFRDDPLYPIARIKPTHIGSTRNQVLLLHLLFARRNLLSWRRRAFAAPGGAFDEPSVGSGASRFGVELGCKKVKTVKNTCVLESKRTDNSKKTVQLR